MRILLDVDTGIDDAIALAYAAIHPELELLGVTCVLGNASLLDVTANSCAFLAAVEADDVPVAAGADRPLLERSRRFGTHGPQGLGTVERPPTSKQPEPYGAVELMVRALTATPEPVTVVALGPQTNVALLLRAYPELAGTIERIVFVGGELQHAPGTTPEFNVRQDPEAAAIVTESDVPVRAYPLEVFRRLTLPESLAQKWARSIDRTRSLVGQLLLNRPAEPGRCRIGDTGALLTLTAAEAFRMERRSLVVDLVGTDRGATRIDASQGSDVELVVDLDVEQAAEAFCQTFEVG